MLRRQIQQQSTDSVVTIGSSSRKRPIKPHNAVAVADKKAEALALGQKELDEIAQELALEEDVLGVGEDILGNLPEISQKIKTKRKRRKKASDLEDSKKWEDSDDEEKKEFEAIIPSWADTFDDERSDDSDEDALATRAFSSLATPTALPSATLDYRRVCDGNKEDRARGSIRAVEFHPTSTVMLTGGPDQTLRLFAVDGTKNRKIHSMFLDQFPIMAAHFSRGGSEVVMGTLSRQFCYMDLMGGESQVTYRKFRPEILNVKHMNQFVVSPDERFLAFLGLNGYIHLFSQKSKEMIHSLKINLTVKSVCFSKDGRFLYAFGEEGKVYVFDMDTRDCVHSFHDDGCIYGKSVAVSPDNNYIVCGSESGIVNVYDREAAMSQAHPAPTKIIKNLRTEVSGLGFNSTSEILSVHSQKVEKALKLVHFPSMTVLPNFPSVESGLVGSGGLKVVNVVDFSPHSGYMAVGTQDKKVLLYRLQHYKSY